ncbi:MAG: M42 family metallopeptidase [Firmicutes bacterium]|nr:M42 family metallopeptidase [Bacillota bacterium]
MIDLITTLAEAYGPVGQESGVRQTIEQLIKPYVDEIRTDPLGNLIAYKSGSSSENRIMLSAHMDEIGLMVTHIDENGFLRFQPLGGVGPWTSLGQRVRFADGTVGAVSSEKLKDIKELEFDKMFIDIGATSAGEAQQKVRIGSVACFDRTVAVQGKRLSGKALDDRVGCAVLVEALRRLEAPVSDVYAVFSVHEEVGARGAGPAAYSIDPTVGIAIDVTPTGDTPEGEKLPVKLGEGVAIKVKDSSLLTHPKVKEHLAELAEKAGIKHQYEVLGYGGTDAGTIHTIRAGIPSGAISIPVRYVHTPVEMVDLDDVEAAVELTCALLESPVPDLA